MNIKYIVIHHSASLRSGNSHQLEAINRYHRDKDWGNGAKCKISKLQYYVQYHYLIEPSGEVIKTAEENELRWHAGDYNGISLGICLTGNFDTEKPTQGQTDSLKRILIELEGRYPDAKIIYHRDIANKTCPGLLITDDWAVNLLKNKTMKIIGDKRDNKQYAQGGDGKLHWLYSTTVLEVLHNSGVVNKNEVEWRDNLEGIEIGETLAVII